MDLSTAVPYSVILYLMAVLVLGLGVLIWDAGREPLSWKVKPYRESWVQFGLMLWIIFVAVFIAQNLWRYWVGDLDLGVWGDVAPGFISHCAAALSLLVIINHYPKYIDWPVNAPNAFGLLRSIKEGVLAFLSAYPLVLLSALIWKGLLWVLKSQGVLTETPLQEAISLFVQEQSLLFIAIYFMIAGLVAPAVEELLFRGVIYRFLKSKMNLKLAAALAALIFAVVHGNIHSFLPLVMLGLLMIRVYERTGNIVSSIVFHSLFNTNTLVLLTIAPEITLMK